METPPAHRSRGRRGDSGLPRCRSSVELSPGDLMMHPSHLLLLAALLSGAGHAAELKVPDNVLFDRNIEYANPDGQHLQLNLARPKSGSGPFPVVLCIHGGGFRAGTREGYDKLCVSLAQHNFVAATITYRLAPKYQFPAAVHDAKPRSAGSVPPQRNTTSTRNE